MNPKTIALENKRSILTLAPDGQILGLVNKATGENLQKVCGCPCGEQEKPTVYINGLIKETGKNTAKDGKYYFCHLVNQEKESVYPVALSLEENVLSAQFADCTVRFQVEIHDDFFTFEVMEQIPEQYYSLSFAELTLDYDYDTEDAFVAAGCAMTYWTNPVYFPSGVTGCVRADCYRKLGTARAKLAVITAPKKLLRGLIQEVNRFVVPGELPITSMGGANAFDHPENFGDYMIVTSYDVDNVDKLVQFCLDNAIDQVDFHQGLGTFRHADFVFYNLKDAAEFKERVTDVLSANGIISSLHNYSAYVDYNAQLLLSEPKWQKDLEVLEQFTLSEALDETVTEIRTNESTEEVSDFFGFCHRTTPFVLIDEEIIEFSTAGKNGFCTCKRGQSGTKAVPHKTGAVVKHLGGFYNMFAPVCGSDLFYEVARRTAKAYNEGGFGKFYMDAFEGTINHAEYAGEEDYSWYYAASFLNEIIKGCERPPIFEYSTLEPCVWSARSSGGAVDTAARCYKAWKKHHMEMNQYLNDMHYPSTFGWYNFYPRDHKYPANFSTKYHYEDDVDYMGALAIAYNQSIVYNPLTEKMLKDCPAMYRNAKRYQEYDRLRKSNYFCEEVKERIRKGKDEFKLVTQDGKHGFVEAKYLRGKLQNLDVSGLDTVKGENPFGVQTPFIRIESLLSSKGEEPVVLLPMDETKPLKEQVLEAQMEPLNIMDKLALKVRVKGNNSDDAICIRLRSLHRSEEGVSDYLVKLDFEGWREFIFADIDTGEFEHIEFDNEPEHPYAIYRACVDYDQIIKAEVFLHGDCEGVCMGDITAVKHTENAITNPTVTVNGKDITFRCTLESTEYLEYTPGVGAFIYDEIGNAKQVNEVQGTLEVPAGAFAAKLSGVAAGNGPARAVLTLGVYGDEFIG